MLSEASLVPLSFLVMICETRLQLAESMEHIEKELPLVISQVWLLGRLACLLSVPFCSLLTAGKLLVLCRNSSTVQHITCLFILQTCAFP